LRSLTYRDMPFVLAPNIWQLVSGNRGHAATAEERAHGDGIAVNADSPEAFEEVFWRTFTTRTREPRCYGTERPSPEALSAFADYRELAANPGAGPRRTSSRQRYLSKNNNNLLRLEALCAVRDASVLLVYRDPIASAQSLFRQHQRFCEMQKRDPFVRRYMDWLGHFEFGAGHEPFCFAVPNMDITLTPDSADYWLDYWNAVHRYVLQNQHERLHLVDHDRLRAAPADTIAAVARTIGVSVDAEELAAQIKPGDTRDAAAHAYRTDLLQRARDIHDTLRRMPRNIAAHSAQPPVVQ
jgi:hypothetical protein